MHPLLPDPREIRVIQQLGKITAAQLETVDQLLLILPEKPGKTVWKSLPQGSKLQALTKRRPPGSVPALQSRLANKRQTLVVVGTLARDATAFAQLTLARKLVSAATSEKAGSLGIAVAGFGNDATAGIAANALAAALAAGCETTGSTTSNPTSAPESSSEAVRTTVEIQGLREELARLRNEIELQRNQLDKLVERQRNLYDDLDYRWRQQERAAGASITMTQPATGNTGLGTSNTGPGFSNTQPGISTLICRAEY